MTPTMYFVEFITFNHCIHHIPNLIKNYCRFTQNFSSHFQNSCLCGMLRTKSLPIMLALCLMLLPSYYAPNYAGIIGSGLQWSRKGKAVSPTMFTKVQIINFVDVIIDHGRNKIISC